MKITELKIDRLHNKYDYDVKFNNDVTFLFGTNGCGKTTILNITEAIITGQIFKLFTYEFKKITLSYSEEKQHDKNQFISITRRVRGLEILVNEQKEILSKDSYDRACDMANVYDEVFTILCHEYSLLEEIQRTFDYVYLPLNRTSSGISDEMRRRIYASRYRFNSSYDIEQRQIMFGDPVIAYVEKLIQKNYQQASAYVQKINDDFRDAVLGSLLEVNNQYYSEDFVVRMIRNPGTVDDVKCTQKKYLKLLTSFNILNEADAEKYNRFFDEYSKDISKLDEQNEFTIPVTMLLKFQEFAKIKTLIPIAEKMEERKAKALHSVELFQKTMNEFIGSKNCGKKIIINSTGKVMLTTGDSTNAIPISNLSSGEKQLLTFFANLIFNVDVNSSAIFVVDEPELSLHLSWQKIFVDKTLEINRNIQLIFATHAPEIIGRYRDKMFKLERRLH